MAIPDKFLGTFELDQGKCENMEAFMKEKNLPMPPADKKPKKTFSKEGDGYRMEMETPKGPVKWDFKLGTPFTVEKGPDGKKHEITYKTDGDNLCEHHLIDGSKEENIKYCMDGDHLFVHLTCSGTAVKLAMKKC